MLIEFVCELSCLRWKLPEGEMDTVTVAGAAGDLAGMEMGADMLSGIGAF
jgi:hypothetical protein